MNNISDSLSKLNQILFELIQVVKSINDFYSQINIEKETLEKDLEIPKEVTHVSVLEETSEVPLSDEFVALKNLLYSPEWPEAVDPDVMCNSNSEDDKKERGENISESMLQKYENKKILDYGCGEGHIISSTAKFASVATGYDIQKTGSLDWETQNNNLLLTTDLNKLKANAPYDVILLYDVLDHVENPDVVVQNIKSLSNNFTEIIVKCHPWCSRHGTHIYSTLNKAYVHLVFTKEELELLKLPEIYTVFNIFPLSYYHNIFESNKLKVKKEIVDKMPIESFFEQNPIVRKRIMSKWNRNSTEEFPRFQMQQSFVDYELVGI